MFTKLKNNKSWTAVPPWLLMGAAAVLLPIVAFVTIENINRQKEKSIHLLLEKGAALIRSFEAGTRTGMMGRQWGNSKLQQLLSQTAQQPDIVHLLVTDDTGKPIAHSRPDQIEIGLHLQQKGLIEYDLIYARPTAEQGDECIQAVGVRILGDDANFD